MAVVSGRLQIRQWTDKDGNNRRSAEIVADNVYFGDSKRDSDGASAGGNYNGNNGYPNSGNNAPFRSCLFRQLRPATPPRSPPASDFAMLEDDDAQLPF